MGACGVVGEERTVADQTIAAHDLWCNYYL